MAPLIQRGPVLASFLLFALLFTTATASSRALLGHSSDIVPDVSLSDDAVGERKVLVDVSTVNGAHYNLAVFEYKLNALGEDDGGDDDEGEKGHDHVSKQCKENSKVALVLLHGATYNHKYWDTPASVDNFPHSFARNLAKQCYFVLAPDMLGTGESSKPDGFTLTLADQAHATADMLRSLRNNNNPIRKHKAKKVILIGHSFGSIMADLILGTNPGIADGFVATGWTNGYEPNMPDFNPLFQILDNPPNSQPYLTLPTGAPFPNIRAAFYDGVDPVTFQPPASHPTWTDAMLAYDVSDLADVISHFNAFADIIPLLDNRRTNAANAPDYIFSTFHTDQITVPVFILCGDGDIFANTDGCARGGAFYPNSARVTSFVQTNIDHVYNQHLTNQPGWQKIVDFVKTVAS